MPYHSITNHPDLTPLQFTLLHADIHWQCEDRVLGHGFGTVEAFCQDAVRFLHDPVVPKLAADIKCDANAHKLQRLAIEVDGPHHFEGRRGRLQESVDRQKDNKYWQRGISLLRLGSWGRPIQPDHA